MGDTLIARLESGAISLWGKAGVIEPPWPRLCHDDLNLWMRDMPFSLDRLIDLARYVSNDTYQTVLDD